MAIVEASRLKVMNLLTLNREKLEKLANELLLKEMLQYAQIEEILGKRPESLFPVHIEEENTNNSDEKSFGSSVDQANSDKLSEKEQVELEEAVARLREGRNISEN